MKQVKYKIMGAGMMAAALAAMTPAAVLASGTGYRQVSVLQAARTTRTSTSSGQSEGPNVSDLMIEDNKEVKGPSVEILPLSENQYEDYGVYAESMGGYASFYATVGNNGITDQPVKVDFPRNLTYTLEKDGVPMEYGNTQALSETGTYQFKVQLIANPDRPLSEQTIYQSNFIFRIQPKIAAAEDGEAASGSSNQGASWSASDGWSALFGGTGESTAPSTDHSEAAAGETSANGQEDAADGLLSGVPDELGSILDDLNGENESEDADSGTETAALPLDLSEEAKKAEAIGELLQVSVPNGMMVNGTVTMDEDELSQEAARITLLKDGSEYSIPADGQFAESGKYTLLYVENGGEKPVTYSFWILPEAVQDEIIYTVPQEVSLTEVMKDDKALPISQFQDASGTERLELSEEGDYSLLMQDKSGKTYTAAFVIDRTPPEVSVEKGNGTATVSYDPSDVAKIVLKSGEDEQVYTSLEKIDRPGSYTLEVYDEAGNRTSLSFKISKNINLAGVAAVFLLIALIGAGVVFVRRVKGNLNVK